MTWVNPYFLRKIHKKYFKVLTGAIVSGALALSMLGKNFSRRHFEIFFLFFPENSGDNLHEMSKYVLWEK